jgi:subtilisin family serine protease
MPKQLPHWRTIMAAAFLISCVAFELPAHANDSVTRLTIDAPSSVSDSYRTQLANSAGGRVVTNVTDKQFAIQVSADAVDAVSFKVQTDFPGTKVAVEEPKGIAEAAPNDPCFTACNVPLPTGQPATQHQWNLDDINVPAAWDISKGSPNVVVAVVDSGVYPTAPELKGKIVKSIDIVPGTEVDNYHGTEVASLIAANTNNGAGIAGVGWNTRIMSVRVMYCCDEKDRMTFYASDLAAGIRAAVDNGADVINLSLGLLDGASSDILTDAINYAASKNVVVVAATNNVRSTAPVYPATLPNVLSVSGVNKDNQNPKSSYGSWVDVYAPSDPIMAVAPSGHIHSEFGTSFAAPQVSGVAALLKAKYPNATAESIRAMIKSTTKVIPDAVNGGNVKLVNAAAALNAGGYWLAGADGVVRNEGSAPRLAYPAHVNKPIVGIARTNSGNGYWQVASDGGIFTAGDANFYGSTGGMTLNKPIVGMAKTPTGNGYWLVASDGGIFTFGDARFYGSTGAMVLNKPIVGMAQTATGKGYWLAASDGGLFSFGDAKFYGSAASSHPAKPIVGMARTESGSGYWMVTAGGGVYAFGEAKNYGSAGGASIPTPIVGITRSNGGNGYFLVSAGGSVYNFGDCKFWGEGWYSARTYVGIATSS